MYKLGVKLACWLLESGKLSTEETTTCMNALMENVGALPYRELITIDGDGQLLINGQVVDIEKARQLQANATQALNNSALKLVREQVAFKAVTMGMHKAESLTQVFWGRVGVWWFQEEVKYLEHLAQRGHEEV